MEYRHLGGQPQYNMLWRVIEAEILPVCEREGIGQLAFSPIAQGVLTGKYLPGSPPPQDSRATDPPVSPSPSLLSPGRSAPPPYPPPSWAPPGPSRWRRTARRPA
jgi:hypothetical protein